MPTCSSRSLGLAVSGSRFEESVEASFHRRRIRTPGAAAPAEGPQDDPPVAAGLGGVGEPPVGVLPQGHARHALDLEAPLLPLLPEGPKSLVQAVPVLSAVRVQAVQVGPHSGRAVGIGAAQCKVRALPGRPGPRVGIRQTLELRGVIRAARRVPPFADRVGQTEVHPAVSEAGEQHAPAQAGLCAAPGPRYDSRGRHLGEEAAPDANVALHEPFGVGALYGPRAFSGRAGWEQ